MCSALLWGICLSLLAPLLWPETPRCVRRHFHISLVSLHKLAQPAAYTVTPGVSQTHPDTICKGKWHTVQGPVQDGQGSLCLILSPEPKGLAVGAVYILMCVSYNSTQSLEVVFTQPWFLVLHYVYVWGLEQRRINGTSILLDYFFQNPIAYSY